MLKVLIVGAVCLLLSSLSLAEGAEVLEDGIYAASAPGDGQRVRQDDRTRIVLGRRLGPASGAATVRSLANDNSRFRVHVKGAGPLVPQTDRSQLALVVDGMCMGVRGRSGPYPDGTVDLSCSVRTEEAARKVAAHFQTEPELRRHPGHWFETRWTPEKESYEVGGPVMLKMEIRNMGTRPFALYVGGQQRGARDNQFRFLAYSLRGRGKAVPDTGDPEHGGGLASFVTLQPGESFSRSVDISGWFALEPGTYRITGIFELEVARDLPPELDNSAELWDDLAAGECLVRVEAKEEE